MRKGLIPFIISSLILLCSIFIGIKITSENITTVGSASFGSGLRLGMPITLTSDRDFQVKFAGKLEGGDWTFSVVSPDNKTVYTNNDRVMRFDKTFHGYKGTWIVRIDAPNGRDGKYTMATRIKR